MSGLNPVLRSEGSLCNRHLNILSARPTREPAFDVHRPGGAPIGDGTSFGWDELPARLTSILTCDHQPMS
jgi:hypothetical protein